MHRATLFDRFLKHDTYHIEVNITKEKVYKWLCVWRVQGIMELRDSLWNEMWQHSHQYYSPTAEPSCIMHAIAQLLDKQSPNYDGRLGPEHARGTFMDLVVASILTTTSYAYALPNILIRYPSVLRTLQQVGI